MNNPYITESCTRCEGTGQIYVERYETYDTCPYCRGNKILPNEQGYYILQLVKLFNK